MPIQTMKAVRIHTFGGPDVLSYEDVPCPKPDDDQVLIQVHAAALNPVDWKVREGYGEAGSLPYILGWDVSGVVMQIGSNVTQHEVGDEVYGMVNFPEEGGAYAEYVVTFPSHIAPKPKSLNHIEASAVPLVGLTIWQSLIKVVDLQQGQRVLIHAAAGGVGHLAVQIAKWKGAEVWGTASERNRAFLESLGIDHTIDYTSVPFEEAVDNLDVVYDTMGGDIQRRSFPLLKPGGFLMSIQNTDTDLERDTPPNIRSQWRLVNTSSEDLIQLTELIDGGHIKPHVSEVFPLTQTAAAHRSLEIGHTRGKIVLQIVD